MDVDEDFSDEDIIEIERAVAADAISKFTYMLALALNIAVPGAGAVVGGAVVADGKLQTSISEFSGDDFGAATILAQKLKWPILRTLPFNAVWDWLTRLPGVENDEPVSSTGRAINSLAHVCVNAWSSAVVLMWSMVGIEAIYTSGAAGLVQQVRERARAFLGDHERADKLISSMYNLRSRFVHGDLNFAGPFNMGAHAPSATHVELREATDLALALLLASVQELIRRNWPAVKFSTSCGSA